MTDLEILKLFREFLNSLRATNSRLAKEKVLEEYSKLNNFDFVNLIKNVFDYDKQFYITSTRIKNKKELELEANENRPVSIIQLLNWLSGRLVTGYQAIKTVNSFIKDNQEYEDIIYNIIDKDIKCGIGVDIVKKYFNIKIFDVQLAGNYDEKTAKNVNENWLISHKIDGCRLLAIFDDEGKVLLMSRQGIPFTTLDVLKQQLEDLNLCSTVLDGEVCLIDDDGKENFQGIMKEIRKKDHVIKNPCFLIFDEINKTAFDAYKGTNDYNFRLAGLKKLEDSLPANIKILEQVKYTKANFEMMHERVSNEGWEGLILRNGDSNYEGKRSKNMLKVKLFKDAEYKVEDVEFGKKPMLANGTMQEVDCVAALIINHKGYKVNIGSGLSDAQRLEWLKDPKEIIGKTITVKYFEQTTDKDGKLSLRFPTLKAIYDGERDV